jgi:hypothetical protein
MTPARDRLVRLGIAVGAGALVLIGAATEARPLGANGNGVSIVRSKSGKLIKVAPSARAALQCVVDYVEARGVKIKAMRGYGPGTVRASLHPSGRALDINQTARNVTHPHVPRAIANAAADHCGVVSGARWGYADNGHWNLSASVRKTQEPWPRVVRAEGDAP